MPALLYTGVLFHSILPSTPYYVYYTASIYIGYQQPT